MGKCFKVVDLFAGPGGLAEGFASLRDDVGNRIFEIVLSVEKDAAAFATLRLRSFFRQFPRPPAGYYRYLSGEITKVDLINRYPKEWAAAERETMMLELGSAEATSKINPILDGLYFSPHETVLIGGPPCQAYSLVGRARNRGVKGYEASKDHRHFLYQEYIRIIGRLKPAAFIMENVKGLLSSKVNGDGIFERVLHDLRHSGGAPDSYTLVPLVKDASGPHGGYIVRSEDYGIPQNRHRVIIVGIRTDRINARPTSLIGASLTRASDQVTVKRALVGIPRLRSGLSKSKDDAEKWRDATVSAFKAAAKACRDDGTLLRKVASELNNHAKGLIETNRLPPRSSSRITTVPTGELGVWLHDSKLDALPNHETRGHMESDLARYAFAAVFAKVFDRSPKASDYPHGLTPNHLNWSTGVFADRFRVQRSNAPSSTITSHISKDGHYFIHPDPRQCRSLTVREAARLQTFPDNYFFEGNRTQQYIQVGNAVPPLLARQIAAVVNRLLTLSVPAPLDKTPRLRKGLAND